MERVERRFGITRAELIRKALEMWCDKYDAATDPQRMQMVLRPKSAKRRVAA